MCVCVCVGAGSPSLARALNVTSAEANEDGGGNLEKEKASEKKVPALRSLTLPTLTGMLCWPCGVLYLVVMLCVLEHPGRG